MLGSNVNNVSNSKENHIQTLSELKNAREARTTEALRIKDEQIRILTDQNNKLLQSMEKSEEEISAIQLAKAHVDEENRQLRESNFNIQSQAKVSGAEYEEMKDNLMEKETQLHKISIQHAQVLKLLEKEEEKSSNTSSTLKQTQQELIDLKVKHTTISNDFASTKSDLEELSKKSTLQSEEIRLLKAELEALKLKSSDEALKSSVEIESLQEQLRVRKEKQYQLLDKLQNQEEARRNAEDGLASLEESLQKLHSKSSSAETRLQLEISSKLSQEDMNNKLRNDNNSLMEKNKELSAQVQKMENEHIKMETDARENGEQLREMAEKVFQLLERLKLADLGKNRAMDALRSKEDEAFSLKKKLTSLGKEHGKECRLRNQLQETTSVLEQQVKDLKKQNVQLGHRCKEEARLKIKLDDSNREAEAKVKKLDARISLLLNKIKTDEEARGAQKVELETLQSQLDEATETKSMLQQQAEMSAGKLMELEKNLIEKQNEVDEIRIKLDALQQLQDEQDSMLDEAKKREESIKENKNPQLAGGRLRFFIDDKQAVGLILLKAKSSKDREWLEKNNYNHFMKKMSKSQKKVDMLLNKTAEMVGIIMCKEEEISELNQQLETNKTEVEKTNRKLKIVHDRLNIEEESKRRTLIKYIRAVKASVSLGEAGCEKNREEVGGIGQGKINLPEVSVRQFITCPFSIEAKIYKVFLLVKRPV